MGLHQEYAKWTEMVSIYMYNEKVGPHVISPIFNSRDGDIQQGAE